MRDPSNLLSVKEDICSNASTCGSDRSVNQLNSGSSDTRSSNTELSQILDENENFEPVIESGTFWGEMPDGHVTNSSHVGTEQEVDNLEPDHLDHAYIRGNYSSDPDLLTWYCLGTC